MKTRICWATGIALSALCAWVGSGAQAGMAGTHGTHDDYSRMLSERDNGRVVTVRVGEEVRVALPENATTGFRWAMDHVDGDVIEVLDEDVAYGAGTAGSGTAGSAAVGSGGVVVFRFRARKPGLGELRLKHWRHWEGDASVNRRFSVKLQAQP